MVTPTSEIRARQSNEVIVLSKQQFQWIVYSIVELKSEVMQLRYYMSAYTLWVVIKKQGTVEISAIIH